MKSSRSISVLSRDFREGILDFLWRQWAQLGVSGTASARDNWAIDPELLLTYSLDAARRDPRLFDEILDWLVVSAPLVSTQRVRNLLDRRVEAVARASLAWAAAQGAAPFRGWQRAQQAPPPEREPLFHLGGRSLHIEKPDPVFESFGLLRPVATRTGKSRPPDPARQTNLAFRLRLLFGVGARAEVARFLLTAGDVVSTRRVAETAAYARRNVADALSALEEAGAVASVKRGRAREWRIDRERWADLLGFDVLDLPRFVAWDRLFRSTQALDDWFVWNEAQPRTDYMRSSTARRLLEDCRHDFAAAGINVSDPADAATALDALDEVVRSLLDKLGVSRDKPRRQHVVSQVVLDRFADADGSIAVYDLVVGRERHSRPSAEAFVKSLIDSRADASEALWGTIEARLPEVFDRLADRTLLQHAELVGVAKDCIALHWARSMSLVVLYNREFKGKIEQIKTKLMEQFTSEDAFYELLGLHPAGPEATAIVEEFVERQWTDRFADGRFFARLLHENFEQARRRAGRASLEVAEAHRGEFLISDNPSLSLRRDHPGGGPLQGVRWDDADTIGMPVGPQHWIALAKEPGWLDLDRAGVETVNRRQIIAAFRSVFYRRRSDLGSFVRAVREELARAN